MRKFGGATAPRTLETQVQMQQELSAQTQQQLVCFEHVETSCFNVRLRTVETALATEFAASPVHMLGHFQHISQAETRSRETYRDKANQSEGLTTDPWHECQTLEERLHPMPFLQCLPLLAHDKHQTSDVLQWQRLLPLLLLNPLLAIPGQQPGRE